MAKIIENEKQFKVIEMSYVEAMICFANCCPVCDRCLNRKCNKGYYIAVLNEWFCKKCYENWLKTAKKYDDDIEIENRNFEYYKNLLEKAGRLSQEKTEVA